MDIVCPVRIGNRNEELRYALRSWHKNLGYRNIILFGAPPAWTCGLLKRPMRQSSYNFRMNTTLMMEAACRDAMISDPFVWMNDDYFIMKTLPEIPKLHRGPIDEVIFSQSDHKRTYIQGMIATKGLLIEEGFEADSILSYELHMPILIHKVAMLYSLNVYRNSRLPNLHKRTLYGNIVDYGGERICDNKIISQSADWDRNATFVSTSDNSFEKYPIGQWLRQQFPEPSPYETLHS